MFSGFEIEISVMDDPKQLYLTINVKMDLFWDDAQKNVSKELLKKKIVLKHLVDSNKKSIGFV